MAIQIDPISSPRIITVPLADGVSITVQSLVNQIREWEHTPEALAYDKLLSASGKEDLGGDPKVLVGITAVLENAKVVFAGRGSPTVCTISGGNLVAVNASGYSMSPIEPSTNVSVALTQSSSATTTAAVAEWTQAQKDSIFADTTILKTDTGTIKTDIDRVEVDVAGVSTSLDEAKHHSGAFEPDKESLEAIRTRLDEVYNKPAGTKGFSV